MESGSFLQRVFFNRKEHGGMHTEKLFVFSHGCLCAFLRGLCVKIAFPISTPTPLLNGQARSLLNYCRLELSD